MKREAGLGIQNRRGRYDARGGGSGGSDKGKRGSRWRMMEAATMGGGDGKRGRDDGRSRWWCQRR